LITHQESDESKYDRDQDNWCLDVKISSSVKTQVVVAITLTQISLYVRVDKENSLEFPLDLSTLLISILLGLCTTFLW